MTTEQIVKAIEKATNGTFMSDCHTSTLMGSGPDEYDEEGRLVSVDPNYKDGSINICGTTYKITKVGWDVYIWKPEYPNASYTWCWKDDRDEYLLTHFSTKPDYVQAYEDKKAAKWEQYQKDFIEKGELVCYLKCEPEGGTNYELRAYDKRMAFVAFNSIKYGNSDRTWEGTKFIHIMPAHQIVFLLRHLHDNLGIDVQKEYDNSVVWWDKDEKL
jgi:hypothetical protein